LKGITVSILKPNCLDDFLINDPSERQLLELILSRKLPFPFNGKSGILLHGYYGTGKSTLGFLLPNLIETACSPNVPETSKIGLMPASEEAMSEVFRCGGGLSSTTIVKKIHEYNLRMPIMHYGKTDYFVFDEVDKLTMSAQQSLKSVMDLPRCQFFFTTNYIDRIDEGIINRSYLVEMNRAPNPEAYLPLGQSILKKLSLEPNALSVANIIALAQKAKGSLRDFNTAVMIEGIKVGGVVPA
jgi:DNA polymerase III delta prime subunit